MRRIFLLSLLFVSLFSQGQSLTPVLFPQYISGVGSGDPANNRNVPYACRMSLSGLIPNRVYFYYNRFVAEPNNTDPGVINGQGNIIIPNATAFQRITSPNLSSTANSGSFTTDANGNYTGWFITEPTASSVYFPGNQLFWRIMLRNEQFAPGGNPTTVELRLTATQPVTVLQWLSYNPYLVAPLFAPQGYVGTLLTRAANTDYTAKNFVMVYDNLAGTGRPMGGSFIEADGSANTTANGYLAPYNSLNEVATRWGVLIPAGPTQVALPNGNPQSGPGLPNGIRNISQYSLANGSIVNVCSSATGVYGAVNTVNPAGTQGTGAGVLNITACTAATCNSLSLDATITGTNCNANTGAINLTVTGGTAPFTYLWSNGATTEDISGLAGGTYSVTVTDASGICTAISSFTVTTIQLINLSAVVTNANSCGGGNGNNGSINLTVNGNAGPYTFTWSNGATTEDISGLAPGSYSVSVTGAGICTATATYTITQAPALTATASATPIPNCGGPSTTVTVNASGGTPPYTGTGNFTVTAGTYTYTVTDATGCTTSATVTVAPGTCVSLTEVFYPKFVQGVGSGSDFNDARVPYVCRMTVSGLTPGATYRYYSRFTDNPASASNGAGQYILVNPTTGTFTRVTSASLSTTGSYGEFTASGTGSFTGWFVVEPGSDIIYTPGNLLYWRLLLNDGAGGSSVATRVTATNPVNVINWGFTSGAANEGSAIYNVANTAWTAKNFVMLYDNIAGTGRPVTGSFIEDDGTANTTAEFYDTWYEINVNAQVRVWGSIIPNNLANGINNISQYALANGNFVNKCTSANGVYGATDTRNASAGNDAFGTLLVIDCTPNTGCSITASTTVTNILCFGASTGAVDLTVTGATAPVTYSWSNGATTQDLTGVVAGTYTVTITDGTGCTATATATVTQPLSTINATATAGTIACNGGSTTLTVTATGGTGALQYSLNGGAFQSGNSFTVNAAGSPYTVTVRDANLCTKVTNAVTVTQPSAIVASASAGTISCNGGTTTLTATATGGTGTLQYSLNGGAFQSGNTFTVNAAGSPYTVTVRDANLCTATTTAITVTQPAVLSGSASSTPVTTIGGSNGTATATPAGGTPGYTYVWSPGGQTTQTATALTAGTYTVTITDSRGCITTASTTVGSPSCNVSLSFTQSNVLCFGASTGTATVTAANTNGTVTYLWSNGQTTATATGLAAGTYSVTVTDGAGCSASGSVTITQPSTINATASAGTISCNGGSTTLTVTATGGTGSLQYSLNGGAFQSGNSFTVNAAGSPYTVTVRDANLCTKATNAVTVTQPSAIVASASAGTISCNGGSTTLTITATGGTGTLQYSLNGGAFQSGNTFTVNAAGSPYTVTVRDANLCTATTTAVSVTQPSAITASSSAGTISCNGGSTTLTVTATGGTGALQYSLNGGAFQSGNTFTVNAAGSPYTVTVRDANLCTATTTAVTVTQPAVLSAAASSTPVTTIGGSNGTATATTTGGTPAYTYLWSPGGQTTQTATALTAGTYTVTITDSRGCTTTASTTVGSPACNTTLTFSQTNVSCFGAANGAATVTATGTSGTVTYLWNNGQTTATSTGLAAGSYSVTVTDGSGCSVSGSVTITQPATINATASAGTIACNGGTTTLTVTATGGTGSLQYSLNGGAFQSGNTFTVNAAGSPYTVTVRDANLCTKATNAVTVTQPSAIVASASAGTISCNGGSTTVTITATGGTGTLQYSLNGGAFQSGNTFTVNAAGSPYTVTVRDANLCTATTNSVSVTQPSAIVASASAGTISCNGGSTTLTVTATGGTGILQYSLNGGAFQSGNTFTVNAAGSPYTVTVRDANLCTITASAVTVTQPAVLSATASSTPVTTNGGSNGTATATATGGTPGYTYLWSPGGQTTQTATALTAGTYTVTITDSRGCITTASTTVGSPACNTTLSFSQLNVSCFGAATGTATVTATGTSGAVTYAWNNGQSTATATGLSAGTYTVTVTDGTGCAASGSVTISQPAAIVASASAGTISCNGGSTTLTVTATGETGALQYSLNGGAFQSGNTFTVNAAGSPYTITVRDANLCTATTNSVSVTQPSAIIASASAGTISCNGGSTTLTVTATGGTGILQYSLNGGAFQSGNTFTVNAAGSPYTVTVRDANLCTITASAVTVTQPAVLSATASSTPVTTNGGSNGTATATATGGTPGYTYLWSPGGQTTQTATALTAGTYTVTITDSRGCITTASTTVGSPACNTTLSFSQLNVSCFGAATGTATVTATGTSGAVTYAWNNGQSTATATGLSAGTYTVTVTDGTGCAASGSVTISQPAAIVASASAGTISCNGGSTTLTVTATGGTGALQYSLNGGAFQSGNTFTVNAAGSPYTVTVKDVNLCTATTTAVSVTQPSAITASASAGTISCNGGSTTLTVTATGGTGTLQFSLNGGAFQSGNTFTVNGAGSPYTVSVRDANLCTATATAVSVTQPSAITASASAGTISCNGGTSTLTVTATGGTGALQYSLNGGAYQSANTFTVNAAGSPYTVTVRDANLCAASTAAVTVTQPTLLTVSVTALPITVPGGNTTVTVSATGGIAPYSGTGNFVRTAGTYSFSVTDAQGCTATATITVVEETTCNIILTRTVTTPACNGGEDGAINLTVAGAVPPVTYQWSNGATTEDICGLMAGTYTVLVTDSKGCTKTATVVVTEPAQLHITAQAGIIPCNGSTTTVTVTSTGGTAPYIGTGTFTRTAGTYSFTVTDARGCTGLVSVTIAPPVPCQTGCTKTQTITKDFVNTPIQSDRYIWFNSAIKLEEKCCDGPIIINVTNAIIKYKKNNVWITLPVPDARIELSNNTYWSTTQFINGKWVTKAPLYLYERNVFMAGLAYKVPAGGIGSGLDDVKWTATINISRPGVKIRWKWAAAVYSNFAQNSNSSIGVKPIDSYWQNNYCNNHLAGTPEHFRNHLKAGGTGWGGNNYTGSYSNSRNVRCGNCNEDDDKGTKEEEESDDEESDDNVIEEKIPGNTMEIIVSPNPSSNYFELRVRSGVSEPVTIRILDAFGRMVANYKEVKVNSVMRMGENWASGVYMAEVIQGGQRKVVRLVKLN